MHTAFMPDNCCDKCRTILITVGNNSALVLNNCKMETFFRFLSIFDSFIISSISCLILDVPLSSFKTCSDSFCKFFFISKNLGDSGQNGNVSNWKTENIPVKPYKFIFYLVLA